MDFTSTYNALLSNTLQLTVSNRPALPAQVLNLTMYAGATAISGNTYSVNTEYGQLTHYPNTLAYQSSGRLPNLGRYPVELNCSDQMIEYLLVQETVCFHNTTTGAKSYNWDTLSNTYPTYIPLNSLTSDREEIMATIKLHTISFLYSDGASIYRENYISFDEEFPLRVDYSGSYIEIPVQSFSCCPADKRWCSYP